LAINKQKRIFIVFLVILNITAFLLASTTAVDELPGVLNISVENISDFDSIYDMQKNILTLEDSLRLCLSTLLYSSEKFHSESEVDQMLKRIYFKIDLSKEFSTEDEIFVSIISESTEDLLKALSNLEESTYTYSKAYEIMEFVGYDFSEALKQFRFEEFQNFLELNKLESFSLISKINGDELKGLTNKIIETIKMNQFYFSNELYKQLVDFGGEKFINYFSIQLIPIINSSNEETFQEQLSLLKTYVNLYRNFYGSVYESKIPKENYNYYLSLNNYFEYLENIEILSRRFITTEATTLNVLSDIFIGYLDEYNTIQIKTDTLEEKIQVMIKNASTRLVYAENSTKEKFSAIKKIKIANSQIQETINNLNRNLENNTGQNNEIDKKKQNFFENIIQKIKDMNLIYLFPIGLIILLSTFIYFILPLKLKGTILKNIGFTTKALTFFQKASIQKPMDADVHIKTAQIYEKMGRDEDAINEYKIASKVIDMKGD
jgi:hypothetical protein